MNTQPPQRSLLLTRALISLGLILAVAADQLSKIWVLANLPGRERDIIPGFLSFQYAENRNMAFGLGSAIPAEVKAWALIALTSALSIALLVYLFRCTDRMMRFSLVLIAGGAIGNIIDRIRLGFVVDFIRWYGGFSWPNFNVADSFICVGVGLMLVATFRGGTQALEPGSPESENGGEKGGTKSQGAEGSGAPKLESASATDAAVSPVQAAEAEHAAQKISGTDSGKAAQP